MSYAPRSVPENLGQNRQCQRGVALRSHRKFVLLIISISASVFPIQSNRVQFKREKRKKQQIQPLKTSKITTALIPGYSALPILFTHIAYSACPVSRTRPLQNHRIIRGERSKLQNISVTRLFSYTWLMVSTPDPLASMYPTRFSFRIVSVADGRPLGEQLIWLPVKGAEATKKMDCLRAHSCRSEGMWL